MDFGQFIASQVFIGLLTAVGIFHAPTPAVLPAQTQAPVVQTTTSPTPTVKPTEGITPTVIPTNSPTPTVKQVTPTPVRPTPTSVYRLTVPDKTKLTPTPIRIDDPPATTNSTYTNSAGNEVQSPVHSESVPSGATARCGDGTYSFSQSRRGTCSHHGGVSQWL